MRITQIKRLPIVLLTLATVSLSVYLAFAPIVSYADDCGNNACFVVGFGCLNVGDCFLSQGGWITCICENPDGTNCHTNKGCPP